MAERHEEPYHGKHKGVWAVKDVLIAKYGKYGITADLIERLTQKGIEDYGYTEEQAVLLLRYTLGVTLHESEDFTLLELATMTNTKPDKLLDRLETMIQETVAY